MRKGVSCRGGQKEIGIRSEEERRTAYAEKTFDRRGWVPLALHRAVTEMADGDAEREKVELGIGCQIQKQKHGK